MLEIGASFTSSCAVDASNSASALGSGDMEVFATPAMIALMENAAMRAVSPYLEEGSTTVGTEICSSHIKATPMGGSVSATARLTAIEGRKLTFSIVARDDDGTIGEGTHTRFIVDRDKFLNKIKKG